MKNEIYSDSSHNDYYCGGILSLIHLYVAIKNRTKYLLTNIQSKIIGIFSIYRKYILCLLKRLECQHSAVEFDTNTG